MFEALGTTYLGNGRAFQDFQNFANSDHPKSLVFANKNSSRNQMTAKFLWNSFEILIEMWQIQQITLRITKQFIQTV